MLLTLENLIGFGAAMCTTASYFPQLLKAWETGSTGDLSLKMLLLLAAGLSLWLTYGALRGDFIIILANAVSLAMLAALTYLKLRRQSDVPIETAPHS